MSDNSSRPVESYAAPRDLPAARRRIDAIVDSRLRSAGLVHASSVSSIGNATVVLEAGRPEQQLARVNDETIFVVSEMVLWSWDTGSIQSLCQALEPDGVLMFLEPTADLGWRRAVHRLGARLWRSKLGYDFERDVPATIRAAGMTVTTTDRFALGPAEIRSYAWGEAQYF